jgi:hypothetical protein
MEGKFCMILLIIGYVCVIFGNLFIAFKKEHLRTLGYIICIIGNISFISHASFIEYTPIVWIFPIYVIINLLGIYNSKSLLIQSR